ncbi:histidine kinase N-terminal 7TM domain-containing protein, partial [Halapricum sp. CBA1109]|uniref:histidine kinase N-terminal 7TM domain-containing protein n=1 Tax=Halapricum sp. CBA1109 TaxID=2668068 RepID=UPI00351B4250
MNRRARVIERVSYAAVFGATALVCAVAVYRAGWLRTDDASVGLRALLVIVGLWSAVQSAQFLAPDSLLEPLYLLGQVTGFASVGAWLYFCSAYTGRQYHRQRRYWIAGLATYGTVTAVKLTQPIHRSYVETRVVGDPFRYLLVDPEPLYWAVLLGAYLLAAVGFYW